MNKQNGQVKQHNQLSLSYTFESCESNVHEQIQATRRRTLVEMIKTSLSREVSYHKSFHVSG